MDQSRLLELQLQMRQNNTDLQSYLNGLDSWTDDIKKKDEMLKSSGPSDEKSKLPPVRNSLMKKKKKKKTKVKEDKEAKSAKPKRIRGYDFRAWDKYDVEKALEEVDGEERPGSSSEYETDEEGELERLVQKANDFKEQGNIAFKEGNYDKAIEFYTYGIDCDPTNAILPANRAMALIKQQKFAAAEVDCTQSLTLDPTYVKAYSRRGTARAGLNKNEEARRDVEKVLSLEPRNKFAKAEREKLDKILTKTDGEETQVITERTGTIRAIYKPPGKRSKKPLKRIQIEEIGVDDGQSIRDAIAKTEASQSDLKRRVTEKDSKMFEQFIDNEHLTTTECQQPKDRLKNTDVDIKEVSSSRSENTESVSYNTETFASPSDIEISQKPQVSQKKAKNETSDEAVTSSSSSPRLPDVPSSSYQFQADWKLLKNHPEMFYQYFKRIDPSQYVKLIGQAMDADILKGIFVVLKDFYISSKADVYPVLKNLTAVKRFSMTVMFMSGEEKQILRSLFDVMGALGLHDSTELEQLSQKYEL